MPLISDSEKEDRKDRYEHGMLSVRCGKNNFTVGERIKFIRVIFTDPPLEVEENGIIEDIFFEYEEHWVNILRENGTHIIKSVSQIWKY